MISEVMNALLITYIATEYQATTIERSSSLSSLTSAKKFLQSRLNQWVVGVVVVANLLDRVTGAAGWMKEVVESLMHLPKILLAAILYTATLYADCLRHHPSLTMPRFLWKVAVAFARILPLYPFLAVLISCIFMFVISLWEYLKLPLEWLNAPIYYGTLYGPFSLVYFRVKQQVVEEHYFFLPTTSFPTTTAQDDSMWDTSSERSTVDFEGQQRQQQQRNSSYCAPSRRYNNPALDAAMRRQQHQQHQQK